MSLWSPALPNILFVVVQNRDRTKPVDVSDIEKALNDTAELHEKIVKDLAKAEDNNDIINEKLNEVIS